VRQAGADAGASSAQVASAAPMLRRIVPAPGPAIAQTTIRSNRCVGLSAAMPSVSPAAAVLWVKPERPTGGASGPDSSGRSSH
jgi:hypothetical protein